MSKEVFYLLTLPVVFFFAGPFFLHRFVGFRTLGMLEKTLINIAVSTGLLTFTLVLAGIFSLNFRFTSNLLFWSILTGLILLSVIKRNRLFSLTLGVLSGFRKVYLEDTVGLFFISLLLVFIVKIVLFLLLKPIVDTDVINYYLPFARTFFLENKIPLYNFYGGAAIFFPPPGISVLYAFSYSLTNSVLSESFRLLPLPFILGTVGTVYLIAKQYFGEKGAKLTTIIFLFLPFWDEFSMIGLFYPDIVLLCLSTILFYLFLKIFERKSTNGVLFLSGVAGLSLGSLLLFKFQAGLIYYFLLVFGLRSFLAFGKKFSLVLPFLLLSPFLFGKKILNVHAFGGPSPILSFVLLGILFISLYIYFNQQKKIEKWRDTKLVFFIFLVSLPFALIWFLRNYFVFGGIYSLVTPANIFTWQALEKILPPRNMIQPAWSEWTLFVVPSLASVWFLPKIIFFLKSFFKKTLIFPLVWILGWYVIWLFFLDGANDRHLLPIFPLISLMIFAGIYWFASRVFGKARSYSFSVIIILLGTLFSMLQSSFLLWNWGVTFFGNVTLHRIVERALTESQTGLGQTLINQLRPLPYKLLTLLNARGDIFLSRIPELILLSLVSSSLTMIITILGMRFSKHLLKFKKEAAVLFSLILLLPYLFTFYSISGGNVFQFAQKEQEKVYNYWGLTSSVVPYLKTHASPDEAVAYFALPRLGLSYFVNLKVYNLLGDDVGRIYQPIFYEKDINKIYQYLKEMKINYFVVRMDKQSSAALKGFRKKTKLPEVFENKVYFKQEIFPDDNSQWALYRIK